MGNLTRILLLALVLAILVGQNVIAAPKDTSASNDVNVVNIPSVIIDNTEAESIPVQVKEYKREPVRISAGQLLSQGTADWERVVYTVPLDKILVIERIDISSASHKSNQRLFTQLLIFGGEDNTYETGEAKMAIRLTTNNAFPYESGIYGIFGSENIRMYAGPGEHLKVSYSRSFSDPLESEMSSVKIQGYLVPADSPSLAP